MPDADHYLDLQTRTLQWKPSAPVWLDVAAFEEAVTRAEDVRNGGTVGGPPHGIHYDRKSHRMSRLGADVIDVRMSPLECITSPLSQTGGWAVGGRGLAPDFDLVQRGYRPIPTPNGIWPGAYGMGRIAPVFLRRLRELAFGRGSGGRRARQQRSPEAPGCVRGSVRPDERRPDERERSTDRVVLEAGAIVGPGFRHDRRREEIMILVVGATGLVGGMIARTLLSQRRPLRVLVREGSDHRALIDAGAEVALGDLKDPASLATACRGVDVLITTASAGQRGGADTPQSVDLEGNRNLITAARAARVTQFIYVSALTATVDHPVPLPRAKAETEVTLRASGLPYTILAANGIMDVMLPMVVGDRARSGQPVTLVGEGRRRHSFVAARDIAAFAVASVDHPAALNRRIPIGGPQPVSWRDIVAGYERALGRAIPVRSIAPGELLPDLPPVPGLTELVSGLLAALETFDSPVEMAETSRTFGVTPTTLDAFVVDAVR